jgi:hypothetical protein
MPHINIIKTRPGVLVADTSIKGSSNKGSSTYLLVSLLDVMMAHLWRLTQHIQQLVGLRLMNFQLDLREILVAHGVHVGKHVRRQGWNNADIQRLRQTL